MSRKNAAVATTKGHRMDKSGCTEASYNQAFSGYSRGDVKERGSRLGDDFVDDNIFAAVQGVKSEEAGRFTELLLNA